MVIQSQRVATGSVLQTCYQTAGGYVQSRASWEMKVVKKLTEINGMKPACPRAGAKVIFVSEYQNERNVRVKFMHRNEQ